jgi:hypothetical protein
MKFSARDARQRKMEKRKERDSGLVRKGKSKPDRLEYNWRHDPAFLMPLPLHNFEQEGCTASGGVVMGDCAVVGVSVIWLTKYIC